MAARATRMLCGAAAALLCLAAAASASLVQEPQPLSEWTNATALFWGGPQDGQDDPFDMRLPPGACGYGEMDSKLWPFYFVTGISPRNPLVSTRPQASCGTCLEVKCAAADPKVCASNQTITVIVTDECPDCAGDELNLHAFAFEQIARLKYGSAGIKYRQVECSPMDNITVRVDGFRVVQGGWLRLSLKSVASDAGIVRVELARSQDGAVGSNSTSTTVAGGPAAKAATGAADPAAADAAAAAGSTVAPADPAAAAELQAQVLLSDADNSSWNSSRTWKSMDNTYGAEWELSGLPAPPYDLRLTDASGRKIYLRRVITLAGATGEFPAHGQFEPLASAPASPTPPIIVPTPLPSTRPAAQAKAQPAAAVAAATAAAKPQPAAAAAAAVPASTASSKAQPAAAAAAPTGAAPTASAVKTGNARRLHGAPTGLLMKGKARKVKAGRTGRKLQQKPGGSAATRGEHNGPMP